MIGQNILKMMIMMVMIIQIIMVREGTRNRNRMINSYNRIRKNNNKNKNSRPTVGKFTLVSRKLKKNSVLSIRKRRGCRDSE